MTTPTTITREVDKIIADILAAEMELDEAHCLLGNQEWKIPNDDKLFLVVFSSVAKPFGAANYLQTDPSKPNLDKEIQQASVLHDCRIEQMSFDQSARVRMLEPMLALGSFLAQQAEGKFGIQIGRPQQPVDASESEPTKRLLKYVTHVNVTALHQKIKSPPAADYFDKFNGATVAGTAKKPQINEQA